MIPAIFILYLAIDEKKFPRIAWTQGLQLDGGFFHSEPQAGAWMLGLKVTLYSEGI
jgi:hypothetical protein